MCLLCRAATAAPDRGAELHSLARTYLAMLLTGAWVSEAERFWNVVSTIAIILIEQGGGPA